MPVDLTRPRATVIISVYRDVAALRAILAGLRMQSVQGSEIVVAEDGEDPAVAACVADERGRTDHLEHTTQLDVGFRKNASLNRAVMRATAERLIFIDGDCVPHPRFVENHLANADASTITAGRRAELGPRLSRALLQKPTRLARLAHPLFYALLAPFATFDRAKNFEAGFYLPLVHRWTRNDRVSVVGCNFSVDKADLVAVNGFDEDYVHPTFGEDTDIVWRLGETGVSVRNVKFVTPLFHLHHERNYVPESENRVRFECTVRERRIVCANGIEKLEAPRSAPTSARTG